MSNLLHGYEARAEINQTPFAFSEYEITVTNEAHDVTNSEGEYSYDGELATPEINAGVPGFYQGVLDGPATADVVIKQATLDKDNYPWKAPFTMKKGERFSCQIYLDGDTDNHNFPCLQ